MNSLGKIERNWKRLWDTLNLVGGAINQRTPFSGDGISVTESPSGFIVALKRDPIPEQPAVGIVDESSTASWRQLTVIDSADCSKKYIWYWGTAPMADQKAKAPASRPISTSADSSFIPVTKK